MSIYIDGRDCCQTGQFSQDVADGALTKATTQGTFAHRFSNWVFRNVIPGIRKTGAYGIPWGALQDFSRRKEQYQLSASQKGRELQACKRKKRELEEEEKRLIREYQPEFYFGNRIQ